MPPAQDIAHRNTSSTSERACDACRIRKLKCPSLLAHKTTGQACARCIKTGLLCTYDAPPRKRGPASGKRLSALRQNQLPQRPAPIPSGQRPQPRPQPSQETSVASSPPVPLASASVPTHVLSPAFHFPAGPSLPYPPLDPTKTIDEYVEVGYAAFPVLDRDVLLYRVEQGEHLRDGDFHALLRGVQVYNEACRLRSDPMRGESLLLDLAKCTQSVRADYDFAENPTLDTVVVSLFLFVAYNVMGRHKRAFLYLTEAIGLLDSVDLPHPADETEAERIRRTRIEYVVFVTENASVSIYGNTTKRRLARKPLQIVHSADALRLPSMVGRQRTGMRTREDMERLDREAMDLLVLMTQLHAATDINEIINIGGPGSAGGLNGNGSGNLIPTAFFRNGSGPVYPTQSADVAITRQWMLANKLPTLFDSCQTNPLAITGLAMILQDMGASVLQWISQLPSGQLRIVGLGKVTAIARTIHSLASQIGDAGMFDGVLRDLVLAVGDNDLEGNYIPLLNDCIAKFYSDIPVAPATPRRSASLTQPAGAHAGPSSLYGIQEQQQSFDLPTVDVAADSTDSDQAQLDQQNQMELESPATRAQQTLTVHLPSELPAPPQQLSNISPDASWQGTLSGLWDTFQQQTEPMPGMPIGMSGIGLALATQTQLHGQCPHDMVDMVGMAPREDSHFQGALASLLGL